jgi:hypothetical protein
MKTKKIEKPKSTDILLMKIKSSYTDISEQDELESLLKLSDDLKSVLKSDKEPDALFLLLYSNLKNIFFSKLLTLTQEVNEERDRIMKANGAFYTKEITRLRKVTSKLTSMIEDLENKPLPDNIPNLKYSKEDKDFVISLKEEKGIPFIEGAKELKKIKQNLNIDSFLRITRDYYNSKPKKRK